MREGFGSLQLIVWYDKCIEERTSNRPPNPLDAPHNIHASGISVMFPLSLKISLKISNNLITASYHRRPDLRLSFVLLVRRSSDDALPVDG